MCDPRVLVYTIIGKVGYHVMDGMAWHTPYIPARALANIMPRHGRASPTTTGVHSSESLTSAATAAAAARRQWRCQWSCPWRCSTTTMVSLDGIGGQRSDMHQPLLLQVLNLHAAAYSMYSYVAERIVANFRACRCRTHGSAVMGMCHACLAAPPLSWSTVAS